MSNPNPMSAVQRTTVWLAAAFVAAIWIGSATHNADTATHKAASTSTAPVLKTVSNVDPIPTQPEDVFRFFMSHLQPCKVEDGRNCSWDASNSGNDVGRDFFDLNGAAVYLDNKTGDLIIYDADNDVTTRCTSVACALGDQP